MVNQTQDLEGSIASYETLPKGNVAVICEKSRKGTPGPYQFLVEIGAVRHYKIHKELMDELTEAINSGIIDYAVFIPKGQYRGYVGIKPVKKDRNKISIMLRAQSDTLGDVTLELYSEYYNPECDPRGDYFTSRVVSLLRRGNVPSDDFKREGFDLDQENLDNGGKILSPNLSQMLYDFQLGQDQFKPIDK